MSKGIQIALGAFLVVGLLGWYSWTTAQEGSFVYYQTLDEFLSAAKPDRAARVHGYVVPGTIERDVAALRVRFRVQNKPPHAAGGSLSKRSLPVVYAGLETPDLFKGGAEIVVEGHLSENGNTFEADNLLAKCPSKFQAQAKGAEAAQSMVKGAASS